jgi:NhaP-type Na+/H+ or K+/H+ antiporter
MSAFRYLTLAIAVFGTCPESGLSLLQLRQHPEEVAATDGTEVVAEDAEEEGEAVQLGQPAMDQLSEALQTATRNLNRALTVNTTKGKVAEAYIALDTIFQDYLIDHYPLCGTYFTKGRPSIAEYYDNDLLGNSLAPMEHEHEHVHTAEIVLMFLFVALALGLFTLHFLSRFAPSVPYTSILFVEGLIMGMGHAYQRVEDHGAFSQSITMWENIDPHLVFFTFLPVLVFGDAMNFNPHIFNKCFGQIMILACPGVVLGTVLTAGVAMYILPYGWDLPVSFAFGAILSATDPVAVVALFKTLGVSPKLTMLISGESVCNDGTAVVIFLLFYKISLGATFTNYKMFTFLANMTAVGPALGALLGTLTVAWLGLATRKHAEEDNTVQVMLTILCAYVAFYAAETVFATSGVLTCVTAATVMANVGLQRISHLHTVEVVWHVFEYVANTLIFLLAGLIVGGIVVERQDVITQQDYLWLFFLYFILLIIRGIVVFSCFPLLRVMGAGMTWQEAVVSTWSGLRGAVGLSLALIMDLEPRIDRTKSTRILFFVGGIAALTLLVNGSTTRYLLQYLGVGMTTNLKEQMLKDVRARMESRIRKELEALAATSRFEGADVKAVQEALLPREEELPTIEELSEPVLDPERLKFLREIHLQVVRKAYQENVDDGTLSGLSSIVSVLIGGVDEALEESQLATGLHDWEILEEKLMNHQGLLSFADIMLKLWPVEAGRGAIREASSVQADENKAVALLNFMHAHAVAQKRVPQFFGTTDDPDSPEERQVAKESQEQVEKAETFLATLPPQAVMLTRSKMLTAKLLASEAEAILHMDELGILKPKDSSQMLSVVHELSVKSTDVIEEHAAKRDALRRRDAPGAAALTATG